MKLKDFSSSKISCVYSLVFPNGKRYVGKTKNLGSRVKLYVDYGGNVELSKAIEEFGIDSIELEVLQEVKCRNEVDLELCLGILEIKYIRELNTVSPNGYNISLGGEILGIPIEHITTDSEVIENYNKGNRALLVYDLGGKFVEEYPSVNRFAYEKGLDAENVRESIGKMTPFRGKWYLRDKKYGIIPDEIEVTEYVVKERVRYKDVIEERHIVRNKVTKLANKVIAYDVNGDFVGEYESNAEAARHLISRSSFVLGKYTQGFIIFKKVSDDYPKKIESYAELQDKITMETYAPAIELKDKPKLTESELVLLSRGTRNPHKNLRLSYAIDQFKLNGEFVARYSSIRDASFHTGVPYPQIYACVNGVTKKAAGFKWRKAE